LVQLVTEATAEARQRTMQVRALRRLSTCEVAGLGIALEQLDAVEVVLVESLPKLRRAAEQEAAVRQAKGQPVRDGAYFGAWSAVRALVAVVSSAREETTYAEVSGKVERPVKVKKQEAKA
jgi:hypothetical protein